MFKNEIACAGRESAMRVADILLEEDYVVMLSKEEGLTIVNFEYVPEADRNGVAFMSREAFEEKLFNHGEDDEYEED